MTLVHNRTLPLACIDLLSGAAQSSTFFYYFYAAHNKALINKSRTISDGIRIPMHFQYGHFLIEPGDTVHFAYVARARARVYAIANATHSHPTLAASCAKRGLALSPCAWNALKIRRDRRVSTSALAATGHVSYTMDVALDRVRRLALKHSLATRCVLIIVLLTKIMHIYIYNYKISIKRKLIVKTQLFVM